MSSRATKRRRRRGPRGDGAGADANNDPALTIQLPEYRPQEPRVVQLWRDGVRVDVRLRAAATDTAAAGPPVDAHAIILMGAMEKLEALFTTGAHMGAPVAAQAQAQGKEIPPELAAALEQARARQQAAQETGGPDAASAEPAAAPRPAAAAPRPAMARRPAAAAPASGTLGSRGKPRKDSGGRAAAETIGRNEVVMVMDPKSGKKEEMKFKKAKPLLEQGWRLVGR